MRLAMGTALGLSLGSLWGCDYSAPPTFNAPTGRYHDDFASPKQTNETQTSGATATVSSGGVVTESRNEIERNAILDSSITLIQRAALQPGGQNFDLAIKKLNQYFEGTSSSEYLLRPEARNFLSTQYPKEVINSFQSSLWELKDARHVEDCMMYYKVANRVAGTGENLTRVTRLFDWVVRQVQLVPAESLGAGQVRQAYARPYDVLMRGVATESEGYWAERAWVFMALCRQLELDSGLIVYTKGNRVESPARKLGFNPDPVAKLQGLQSGGPQSVIWICAVLIDGKAYLFDARVGMPIPGPGGKTVATLEDAMTDSSVLEQMNLPGESPYGTSRASLLASPTKLGILLDSSMGYYSPKMNLLQRQLSGKNRTILYRDAVDQKEAFSKALGDRLGTVAMWPLPFEVETRLFTDAQFVQSTQQSLILFRLEFPLIYARVKQLRGETDEAIQDYVAFRFAESGVFVTDKKTPIPRPIQEGLDVYSSYYLGLAQMEKKNLDQAADMFRKLLDVLPAPSPSLPYFNMFRWGANANLGRIYEAKGDIARAIAYYSEADPTSQHHGNLLAARELSLRDPASKEVVKLPPPPVDPNASAEPANTPPAASPAK